MSKAVRSSEGIINRRERDRQAKASIAKARREYAIRFLGGKCAVCGSTDRLEIDHKDRKKKLFPISRPPSELAFKQELLKCQLLCYRHHKQKSARENSGERNGNAKLTIGQVEEIRAASALGETGRSLAKRFGVGPMQISRILRGLRWKYEDN